MPPNFWGRSRYWVKREGAVRLLAILIAQRLAILAAISAAAMMILLARSTALWAGATIGL